MARRIIETAYDSDCVIWDEVIGPMDATRFLGVAYLSPLTGAWLVMAGEGHTLRVFDREPAMTRVGHTGELRPTWYPPSLRMRSLTGARMALLGGNGHRYRGHSSITRVFTSRTVGRVIVG